MIRNLMRDTVDVYRPTESKLAGTDSQVESRSSTPALTGVRALVLPLASNNELILFMGHQTNNIYRIHWLTEDIRQYDVILWKGAYYDVSKVLGDTLRLSLQMHAAFMETHSGVFP